MKSQINIKFKINITHRRTTTMNHTRAHVTVIQSNQAGMTATLANFDLSFLAAKAAPVIRAIDAINWFAAPKEPQMMSQLPVAASHIPIAAGIIEATQRLWRSL